MFGGDEELGLGPDEDAIELWKQTGVPEERIVLLDRVENFWQAGETGPCGPSSEMYIDRGPEFGDETVRPGDDTERYLEYWNLVFMSMELHEDGSVTDLPTRNIDTGLGLERMAMIQQGVTSVFETDGFRPLVELAEEMCGRGYADDLKTGRAMRILADHSRGMVNLIADGVVPSNEDRGYVLRRVMRRAILQGRVLGLEAPYLGRFAETAIEHFADGRPAPDGGARHGVALGERRGGELRPHARPRLRAARAADRPGEAGGHVLGLGRRRLPAPRHLRLSLRDDSGAARRGGPLGRRPGLRGADGAAARARAPRLRRGGARHATRP